MRNILLLGLLLFAASAFASEPVADSTKVKKKKQLTQEQINKRNAVEKKFQKFSKDRFAIDLLGTNWIYNKNDAGFNGMQTKWWSRGINIYFYYDFRIKKIALQYSPGHWLQRQQYLQPPWNGRRFAGHTFR